LQGRIFTLAEGEWSVGRSSRNHLWLDDPEVSRRHCVFTTHGDHCELRDLDSRNHVFVNGELVTSAVLATGDEIVIGSSLFGFSVETPSTAERVEGDTRVTQLRPEESAYLSGVGAMQVSPRSARDLKTLLRLANMLQSVRNLNRSRRGDPREEILERVVSVLRDVIPGGSAAMLTEMPDNPLAERARRERVALWVRDDDPAGMARLAAPLLVRGDVPAVLYLESASHNGFDQDDLQLLTAIAEITAVAWENASVVSWLQERNHELENTLGVEHEMLGDGAALQELQRRLAKAAPADSSVLILGESGTGKELVARALHRNSSRANGPFFAINCAALTDTLLESELFGHEKGAFTGATETKRGRLEAAQGGTIFFDEIGELALPLQAKLLRVIENREMQRVGGTKTIRLDIRIVAATNRDLEEALRNNTFRQDLYYRLKVITLRTPALREHAEDIPLLAEHFARKYATACGRRIVGICGEAMAYLRNYSWPGNVRELANALESAVVLGSTPAILPEDLPEQVRAVVPAEASVGSYARALETAKRDAILRAFEDAGFDHDGAARALGLHPNYLHKLLRTMDLRILVRKRGAS